MRKLLFLVPFLFALMSCSPDKEDPGLSVASWNVFLMFDGTDDGTEYSPFRGDNGKVYERRLDLTEEVLEALNADILVLQEIESDSVLRDLIDRGLGHFGFRYYGIAENGHPISVGFISKLRPERTAVHSSDGFRPFLDVTFHIGNDAVRVFMIHARSRMGGGERERDAMFSHLMYLASDSDIPVIIAGDFNEDPFEGPSFMDRRLGRATLPVTGDPALTRHDLFYTAVLEYPDLATFNWEGEWRHYDNILVNDLLFDGWGLEYGTTDVYAPQFMLDEYGVPKRFNREKWSGWSDHLPIVTRLSYH